MSVASTPHPTLGSPLSPDVANVPCRAKPSQLRSTGLHAFTGPSDHSFLSKSTTPLQPSTEKLEETCVTNCFPPLKTSATSWPATREGRLWMSKDGSCLCWRKACPWDPRPWDVQTEHPSRMTYGSRSKLMSPFLLPFCQSCTLIAKGGRWCGRWT